MAINALKELTGEIPPEQALNRIAHIYKLTKLQQNFVKVFVEKYGADVKKRNAAYIDAGGMADKREMIQDKDDKSKEAITARKAVAVTTHAMWQKKKITNSISEYKEIYALSKRNEIEDDVYRITKLRANYDIRKMADVITGANPEEIAMKLRAMDEETAVCIDGFDFKYHGKDADKFTVTFKFADRDKAVDRLSKLTGMMVDRKEVKHEGNQMPTINISVMGDNGVVPELKDVTEDK